MKTIKTLILIAVSATLACVAGAQAQTPSLEQMQAQLQAMQQMVTNLQQQITELKGQQKAPPSQATTESITTKTTGDTNDALVFIAPQIKTPPQAAQVKSHETFRDYQEGAPRAGNLTLDPKYRGFMPIPNTPAFIKFNGKVKVDVTDDNRNSGNPDRFVTAQFPTKGEPTYGEGNQANVNARGSSLSVDVRAPDFPGNPRFYYNNDFFGGGTGVQMGYRVKQLWGEYYNFTAGFTYSPFEDPDVWPDTVDFEGPNSMIFARQATLRYQWQMNKHWQMNIGVHQPASDIDTVGFTDVSPVNHAPDFALNLRWENEDAGHVQLATILRDVGSHSPTIGNDSVFGWGLMAATSLNICKDSVQAQATFGDGYFHYMNDNFTYGGFNGGDAAFDSSNNLKALQCYSGMLGYTHNWCDKWRSTATVGYVNLKNEFSEGPLAYHHTLYTSANIVYQLRKRVSIGLEGLYGKKEVKDGAEGDVFRLQLGVQWGLWD
ncbi:MAG: DcaP family trimeric outer membrane transporter [Limisphaerales bacterium]